MIARLFACFLLLGLFPFLILLGLAIRINLGSPVLFRQLRPGLHGKPFTLFKFRTMRDAVGPDGRSLPDAQRVTRFGRILRSTSLGELPELVNVIRGEMAFVGPRPLLMEYLPLYTPAQARRHEVLPGITGWAQVNGRNSISWDEKFSLDLWYVDNRSFWIDCLVIVRTVLRVFRCADVDAPGGGSMPLYKGCDKPLPSPGVNGDANEKGD